MKNVETKRLSKRLLFTCFLCTVIPFFLSAVSLQAQQIRVTGTITDTSGEPVIGANILVANSQTGTITDYNGTYSIQAPANGELLFSYIGMLTQTEKIN